MNRRQFVVASTTALAVALHETPCWGAAKPKPKISPRTRFRHLRLRTTVSLQEMEHFYAGAMGFGVDRSRKSQVTFYVGGTKLTFVWTPADESKTAPWYHVAFNIPENKILSARDWQLERTPLDNNIFSNRHPDHPDIVDFSHWDAHSVFFRDPAGNLLEHIARHTLDNSAPGRFSSRDIACCSEIALVLDADDVRPGADHIGSEIGLSRYRTSGQDFAALGDENGLVLIMRKGVSLRGQASVFPTEVEIEEPATSKGLDFRVEGYPYRISSI